VILIQSVSKVYHLYQRPTDRIVEMLPLIGRPKHKEFWALRNINLHVDKGEILGVIGPNGSGKSTLLQIVAGIVQPSAGRVAKNGRSAALLELGAGFSPEFTGRENVFLNGQIMGLSRSEMERVFPDIAAFAEIGEFIDRPVKEYSSGMYVRLAFSTAIHVDPDILIVDEALAVGDAVFSSRCIHKFEELKRNRVTILFVSHDLGLVKQLADRAVFLLNGEIAAEGRPSEVVNRYVGAVLERGKSEAPPEIGQRAMESSFRHGDGASRVIEAKLLNKEGRETKALATGERARVRIRARFQRKTENPVVGILIRNRLGIDVFGTNSRIEGVELGPFSEGEVLEAEFVFDCHLTRQDYTLTVATQNWDGTSQDWLDDAILFSVVDTKETAGVVRLGTTIEWSRESRG